MHIHRFRSVFSKANRQVFSQLALGKNVYCAKCETVPSLSCSVRLMSVDSGGSDGGTPPERIPRAGKYRSGWTILKEEAEGIGKMKPPGTDVPRETDVLVVGGGVIGSAVAYWIKERNPKGSNVVVVERDPMYTRAATMLSAGGIRHQFSIPENVQLSMFATDFFTNIKDHLSVIHESPPDIGFNHQGYLFLAAPRDAQQMVENVRMQNELGAKVVLLTKAQLAEKYPWLNLDGVECGSLGLEGEGWIDPWSLLRAFKQKNISLGTKYIHGELVDFDFLTKKDHDAGDRDLRLDYGVIRTKDGREHEIRFSIVVNCAGPWAADIAEMAKIGTGDEELVYPLPIEPRKRFVYVTHCPDGPMLEFPFVVDPSGLYVRREGYGGNYIVGKSPASEEEEPDIGNFEVDYDFYDEQIWPSLANRIPAFNKSKLKSAWAGYYDYNSFDQNLVIGPHPYHRKMVFACGLSGHGLQHSVGVGRAVAELILDAEYQSIDLSRFHFERFINCEAIEEQKIV